MSTGLPASALGQNSAEFQQGVEYRIEAVLDEERDLLSARAHLTYTNNSSEVIDTLFFHQHLNAFRPNSAWARRELETGNRRFTDLAGDEHAFERLLSVEVSGVTVAPLYPGAPDSTVMALPLPQPLAPGGVVAVELDWEARPSTLPRRQGRRGRHYDFAQWYPRIAVYDEQGWQVQPLMPQGEFYGEFATFDVVMDLASDQVVGATGVPVEGDPGWESAAAVSAEMGPVRSAHYGDPGRVSLGLISASEAAGRKHVRWRAENVHHFAWTTNPEYIYEGGRHGEVGIHVLYQPGDEDDWGGNIVVDRTVRSLAWLETVFGDYPYPQVTNVHRIEGGGTEFPMLVMDGAPSQGLITHEVGHIYVHGILANNEWRDAWLDEGFASFVTSWFGEEMDGNENTWQGTLRSVAAFESAQVRQPSATRSADFLDFQTYNTMSYSKGSVVLYMLREFMGEDDFRRGLQLYFRDNKFEHVTELDLQNAMEAIYGGDLGWFFQQWIHTSDGLDYSVDAAETAQLEDGRWQTRVQIQRTGAAWMPVWLSVGEQKVRLASREVSFEVMVVSQERPSEVVLDPDFALLDRNRENNSRRVAGGDR